MIGITLTSEQIRNAPADVRRWIEREVMMSLGQHVAPENGSKARGEHLATCSGRGNNCNSGTDRGCVTRCERLL